MQVQAEAAEVPFDPRQVKALLAGLVLLEVENVAVVAIDEFGNGGVQSLAVRTLHQQDRGVFHGACLLKIDIIVVKSVVSARDPGTSNQDPISRRARSSSRTTRANGLGFCRAWVGLRGGAVARVIAIHASGQSFAPFFRSNQPNPAARLSLGFRKPAVQW